MEVKINKEIREYTESIFFGLSVRQCFFSVIACVVAVILYFVFIDKLGIELAVYAGRCTVRDVRICEISGYECRAGCHYRNPLFFVKTASAHIPACQYILRVFER